MKLFKPVAIVTVVLLLIMLTFFLGKSLNPLTSDLFPFHDASQAARVSEFSYNIQTFHIPPRIAPHFENGKGYAAFNFYAPFAYWVTSLIHLAGFPIPGAIKLSFLLALFIGFGGTALFARRFFSFFSSLSVGILYITGVYFAVNIFVRGNLAEVWYMALLPLAFFLLMANGKKATRLSFVLLTLVISFVLTVHTIFSPLSLILFGVFICLQPKKGLNFLSLCLGFGLASYFIVPAIIELPLTYAHEVATLTKYADHFVCVSQLWSSPWGYAGSAPGCETDGISFMLGKLQIVTALLGTVIFLHLFFTSKKKRLYVTSMFFLIIGISSFFLTLYQSAFIWNILDPLLSVFQFPWRLLTIITFILAFFSGYLFDFIEKKVPSKLFASCIIISIAIFALFSHSKYFVGQSVISQADYEAKYLSTSFITQEAAKYLPEYFSKSGDFYYWKSHSSIPSDQQLTEDTPFHKTMQIAEKATVTLPVLYLPYWNVTINGVPHIPSRFNKLAEPEIHLKQPATIVIAYQQTPVEKTGNIISIVSLLGLLGVVLYTKAWQNIQKV